MAFRKKRVYKKRRVVKRKTYARKKISPIRKMIKKEISRQAEDKTASVLNLSIPLVSVNNISFNQRNVIDVGISDAAVQVYQGTGQGQRIGNKIKLKRLMLKGTLVPLPYSANNTAPCPVQVKMVVFYDKYNPSVPPTPGPINATLTGDFFQNGNSINPFQNDLTDMWLPYNTDKYRIVAQRTFKLGYASFGNPTEGQFPTGPGLNNNNDFKLNCNFSINLAPHYPKLVNFRDNTGNPSNRGLWMMLYYARADGSQYTATTEAVGLQYMVDCKFEDM